MKQCQLQLQNNFCTHCRNNMLVGLFYSFLTAVNQTKNVMMEMVPFMLIPQTQKITIVVLVYCLVLHNVTLRK